MDPSPRHLGPNVAVMVMDAARVGHPIRWFDADCETGIHDRSRLEGRIVVTRIIVPDGGLADFSRHGTAT